MPQPTKIEILETSLYADDLAAAEDFYVRILGLAVHARAEGRHIFFRCGDRMLLIFKAEATERPMKPGAAFPVPPHGARGAGHVCFRADGAAIDAWARHLVASGVSIESTVTWPGGGRSIYFRDPAGNSLEFAEARIWGIP